MASKSQGNSNNGSDEENLVVDRGQSFVVPIGDADTKKNKEERGNVGSLQDAFQRFRLAKQVRFYCLCGEMYL